ncbi:MAG: dihydroorotase [Anaerovoracaceae bacterium]|jgi:dihydroorotase
MKTKLCIKNGYIVDPANKTESKGNLWVRDGIVIDEPKKEEQGDFTVIDAEGKWVVPGFIDLHVHFREPGFEYKEDIQSGCKAAAAGGFTTVCCMPNTKPAIDRKEIVSYIDEKAKEANAIDVFSVGAITINQEGSKLADYKEMLSVRNRAYKLTGKGIVGISEDGKTVESTDLMREAMKIAKDLDLTVFSHAEPEVEIVERDLNLAKEIGCSLHFCHISEKESIQLIREGKAKGIKVTAETAPHYFTLDESMVKGDPNKKMNPPIQQQEDVEAVFAGLKDGTLDVIATDHAPHHEDEKELEFSQAPFGVTGLETSFAISYTSLVKTGTLSPMELIYKMSTKPAEIIGLERGNLAPGKAADITILDVNHEYLIKAEDFQSKAKNSPFLDQKVFGSVVYTIKDGEIVWERKSKSK